MIVIGIVGMVVIVTNVYLICVLNNIDHNLCELAKTIDKNASVRMRGKDE